MSLYIGLMSGTSADGVDATLVDFSQPTPKLLACKATPYPTELKSRITQLYTPSHNEIDLFGPLDVELGHFFAQCVSGLLAETTFTAAQITAIGSHGQTIRHRPRLATEVTTHNVFQPFTLQIGDPNTLAYHTGITTIADFRRKDIAAGGQGAPLTPAFHHAMFASSNKNRAVLNIGGIANITCLPIHAPIIGFDTGPGNGLMDAWIHATSNKAYDKDGNWARTGQPNAALLNTLLAHPYFELPPPKSTGREEFSIEWLNNLLNNFTSVSAQDVQATLLAFTATSIAQALKAHVPAHSDIYTCGGGVHNSALMEALKNQLSTYTVHSTLELGVEPDWVEAMAFAWFAKQTLESLPGNEPSVTGAEKAVILGGIYPAG